MTTMKIATSKEIQTNFGKYAEIVKGHEPVAITHYGRPTLLVLRYDEGIELLKYQARERLFRNMKKRAENPPEALKEITLEELNQMIDEEREAIYQEKISKNNE